MKPGLAMTLLVAGCGACGGGSSIDATPVVDIDNGSCGDQLRFTGEYIDWESGTAFCGIFDAKFDVQGGGAMDSTAPNGRFDLCIPSASATTLLDVTPPTAMSECSVPPSSYATPGIAVATAAVIRAGAAWSGRSFTVARRASLFQAAGLVFDATRAHVFVHVSGTPRAVSIAAGHAAALAKADTTWAAGDTGPDVFFPNVEVGSGSTMLTVAGGAIGSGAVPLVAGKITNVSVLAN